MAPEVFFTVCYRNTPIDVQVLRGLHQFRPALLHGYCRRRVFHADYPGITADAAHNVFGVLVTGLTDANVHHLDNFEGDQYERRPVKARLLRKVGDDDGGAGQVEGDEVETEVYVFTEPAFLEDREWDFHEFRTQKMKNWTKEDYGFEDDDADDVAAAGGEDKTDGGHEFKPIDISASDDSEKKAAAV
jgi:hypothetical protein